jgi:amidase
MSARELADAIRTKQASAREVIDAHLRRIDTVNLTINAVTVVLGEDARRAADHADAAVASGADLPPLHGVPFTVKENIDLAGTPTTQGAKASADAYPTRDAPVVERLKAAGAIPIGRTNLPTYGVGWVCESELHGATVNPWDPTRTPGASSGGEAAAIATGMSPLGLGNDGFGSLRWPVQCCGIASLRPTLGRVPHATTIESTELPIAGQLLEVEGPLARRVGDLRAAYEVLAGPTWRDPWTVPAPLRGPAPAAPVRVALVVDPASHGIAEQVADGVLRTAAALAGAGYLVEEVEPPSIDLAAKTALEMLTADLAVSIDFMTSYPAEIQGVLRALIEHAGHPDQLRGMLAYMTRQSLLRAWGEFQEHHPLVVAPIFTDVPFTSSTGYTPAEVANIVDCLRMTIAVNGLGLPALALTVGVRDGLPQAVQIIGPRYREDLCFDAAEAVEERVGIVTPIDPRADPEPPRWRMNCGAARAEAWVSRWAVPDVSERAMMGRSSSTAPGRFDAVPLGEAMRVR